MILSEVYFTVDYSYTATDNDALGRVVSTTVAYAFGTFHATYLGAGGFGPRTGTSATFDYEFTTFNTSGAITERYVTDGAFPVTMTGPALGPVAGQCGPTAAIQAKYKSTIVPGSSGNITAPGLGGSTSPCTNAVGWASANRVCFADFRSDSCTGGNLGLGGSANYRFTVRADFPYCTPPGSAMGASCSPAYAFTSGGVLAPIREIEAAAARTASNACPICDRRGWDGVWRDVEALRGERGSNMRGSPSRNARKTTGTRHQAPGTGHQSGVEHCARAEKNRDRGLGDTVARVIRATTGIEATEGCGCSKRKEWLNKVVPYGRNGKRKDDS